MAAWLFVLLWPASKKTDATHRCAVVLRNTLINIQEMPS